MLWAAPVNRHRLHKSRSASTHGFHSPAGKCGWARQKSLSAWCERYVSRNCEPRGPAGFPSTIASTKRIVVRRHETHQIENVKEFPSKLDLPFFRYREKFDHAQVHIFLSGTAREVARRCSEGGATFVSF